MKVIKVIRIVFYCIAVVVPIVIPGKGMAEQPPVPSAQEQVIEPQLDRRVIKVPQVEAEDIEIGAYFGVLSIEDFGSNPVAGIRAAYHITEKSFAQLEYGSSQVSDSYYRLIGPPIFVNETEALSYYHLSIGYSLFPGEIFVSDRRTLTSAVYLISGVGATSFDRQSRITFNFGLGVRMMPSDRLAFHIGMRDYLFESDYLGSNKLTHNFQLSSGISLFF
jgi:outer membrane beta-barrel protein